MINFITREREIKTMNERELYYQTKDLISGDMETRKKILSRIIALVPIFMVTYNIFRFISCKICMLLELNCVKKQFEVAAENEEEGKEGYNEEAKIEMVKFDRIKNILQIFTFLITLITNIAANIVIAKKILKKQGY